MTESIRFDRAVEYYDRTRALAPEVVARQTAILMHELRDRGSVLEVGVGTGRIAVTLDVPVVGLDLSRPMMEVLRTKSTVIPLVEGDATRLPFPDGVFGAAYAAHVFHLIAAWETALAELVRVVRPGGVILAVRGSGSTDVGREMARRFLDAAGAAVHRIGADTIAHVDDAAARLGLPVRELDQIVRVEDRPLSAFVDELEQGMFAGVWEIDAEVRRRAADRLRAWVVAEHGSADAVVPATSSFAWHAYDVPS